MTDQQLVLRVRAGEDWAFEELVARHDDLITNRIGEWGARGEQQEDFRQVALLALYKAACSYRPGAGAGFRHYAGRVMRNSLIDFLDASLRGKHRVLDDSMRFEQTVRGAHDDPVEFGELMPGPASADPCEIVIAREDFARRLRVLMCECSPAQQAVVARRLNGLSYAEAGRGIGKGKSPAKAADNALTHVRRKLAAAA